MGFFSDLFEVAPYRTVGQKAYDYCINSSLSRSELNIVCRHKFDKDKYVNIRNICQIKMFTGLFQALDSKRPNASYRLAHGHFQQLYWDDYMESIGGWAMWENQQEEFCLKVTGMEFFELNPVDQKEISDQIAEYQAGVINFFKEYEHKLSKSYQ